MIAVNITDDASAPKAERPRFRWTCIKLASPYGTAESRQKKKTTGRARFIELEVISAMP